MYAIEAGEKLTMKSGLGLGDRSITGWYWGMLHIRTLMDHNNGRLLARHPTS